MQTVISFYDNSNVHLFYVVVMILKKVIRVELIIFFFHEHSVPNATHSQYINGK